MRGSNRPSKRLHRIISRFQISQQNVFFSLLQQIFEAYLQYTCARCEKYRSKTSYFSLAYSYICKRDCDTRIVKMKITDIISQHSETGFSFKILPPLKGSSIERTFPISTRFVSLTDCISTSPVTNMAFRLFCASLTEVSIHFAPN